MFEPNNIGRTKNNIFVRKRYGNKGLFKLNVLGIKNINNNISTATWLIFMMYDTHIYIAAQYIHICIYYNKYDIFP